MFKLEWLEFTPIVFAMIAIIVSALKINNIRRKSDFIVCILSIVGPILLIVAQTSWWVTAVIENNLLGTWFANQVWTVFNTMMMVLIIILNRPRDKK